MKISRNLFTLLYLISLLVYYLHVNPSLSPPSHHYLPVNPSLSPLSHLPPHILSTCLLYLISLLVYYLPVNPSLSHLPPRIDLPGPGKVPERTDPA